jgi:hypothetical protein
VDQRIPLGAGRSPHAVRRQRWPRRLGSASTWSLVAAGAGVAASLVGVTLAATAEPHVAVGLDAAGYRIDGQQLRPAGDSTYQGASGGVLVIQRTPARIVAAASSELGGRHMTGRCQLVPGAASETCDFTVGGQPVSAVDSRTDAGWHRRYGDGQSVSIDVTGDRDTPVPFAVAR